jgi:hypothetical protein
VVTGLNRHDVDEAFEANIIPQLLDEQTVHR